MVAAYRHSIEGLSSGSTIPVAASGLTCVAGDVLVLDVFGFATMGTPSGASDVTWSEELAAGATGPFGDACYHKKFVGVAPDASLADFTIANGKSDTYYYVLTSVSGADTTTPVDAKAITGDDYPTSGPVSPTISPTGSDSLLLCAAGVFPYSDTALITGAPSGMTLRQEADDWETFGVATLGLSASGATGTKTWGYSGTTDKAWICSSIAIKAAAGGGGGLSIPVVMNQYRQRVA
jgi:hypothetical protein